MIILILILILSLLPAGQDHDAEPDLLTARLLLRINKASAAFFLQTLSCLTSTRVLTCNPPLGTLYSSQSYDSLSLYFHLLTT